MIEKTSLKKPLTQVRGSFLNKLFKTTIKMFLVGSSRLK